MAFGVQSCYGKGLAPKAIAVCRFYVKEDGLQRYLEGLDSKMQSTLTTIIELYVTMRSL